MNHFIDYITEHLKVVIPIGSITAIIMVDTFLSIIFRWSSISLLILRWFSRGVFMQRRKWKENRIWNKRGISCSIVSSGALLVKQLDNGKYHLSLPVVISFNCKDTHRPAEIIWDSALADIYAKNRKLRDRISYRVNYPIINNTKAKDVVHKNGEIEFVFATNSLDVKPLLGDKAICKIQCLGKGIIQIDNVTRTIVPSQPEVEVTVDWRINNATS